MLASHFFFYIFDILWLNNRPLALSELPHGMEDLEDVQIWMADLERAMLGPLEMDTSPTKDTEIASVTSTVQKELEETKAQSYKNPEQSITISNRPTKELTQRTDATHSAENAERQITSSSAGKDTVKGRLDTWNAIPDVRRPLS